MRSRGTSGVVVDDDGLVLPVQHEDRIKVAFDGRTVCTFSAARGRRTGGTRTIRWPNALRRFLDGTAVVTIVEHGDDQPLFEDLVSFGSGDGSISVVDHLGRPLIIDKWSRLERPFDAGAPGERLELVQLMLRLINDLTERVGVPAFAIYGTLLGAVRAGEIIEHDVDLDIAYLSEKSHPADLAIEALRVARRLRDLGWTVDNQRAARLKVLLGEPYRDRYIDVFVSYYWDGQFNVDKWVAGRLPRNKLLPLSSVTLEGHLVPAPADPEAVLELTYGSGWRVPDPGFSFVEEKAHVRRVGGWMGHTELGRRAWQLFYEDPSSGDDVSPFARWVIPRLKPDVTLLDIGCGRGRDTIAFADHVRAAHGWDYIPAAISAAQAAARSVGSMASFRVVNVADIRQALPGMALVTDQDGPHAIYGRLVLDALTRHSRFNVWMMARTLLRNGGCAYFEFRAGPGRPLRDPAYGHWVRPLDFDALSSEIGANGGAVVHHEIVRPEQWCRPRRVDGEGRRPYPPMHRIVTEW
jgi:SAM-dependent methyltransferase